MVLVRHYASRASGVAEREGLVWGHAEAQKTKGDFRAALCLRGVSTCGCDYL